MKFSFCSDADVLAKGRKQLAKDHPIQLSWQWRKGWILVSFKDFATKDNVIDKCGGELGLRARVQLELKSYVDELEVQMIQGRQSA